jgi:hypothetical protein
MLTDLGQILLPIYESLCFQETLSPFCLFAILQSIVLTDR